MNPVIKSVLERDFKDSPPICLFCKNHFGSRSKKMSMVIDHLDNDTSNNALWNYAVSHAICNQRKKLNVEYQHIAINKVLWNKAKFFDEARALTSENEHINSNMILTKIASKYLEERLSSTTQKIEYSDTIDCITYLQVKEVGHGSSVSTQRAMKTLTCSIADWKVLDTEEGKFIVRRAKNEG